MSEFAADWYRAASTATGLFWTAFWAFGLGYLISSLIQVFVTRRRMRAAMGTSGAGSVALATAFGFISSSCSFAALSTTRALFGKGAGLVPALAFLLASTNLVIELGIVIAIFLGWQFVAGEYLGGLLLIALMWIAVRLTLPADLERRAREHAREREGGGESDAGSGDGDDWRDRLASPERWRQVARTYVMEWRMVWKDVTIGFTVAGVIAAFVPTSFFHGLFPGAGTAEPGFGDIVLQAVVGPVAAFFTFIGSMGNIPLAAVLFENGVSFAGVMAFVFSDLVVFPVLRIQAGYYGWRMALYILAVFLAILVTASLVLHYGFAWSGLLPAPASAKPVVGREFFVLDWGFALNVVFLVLSACCVRQARAAGQDGHDHDHGGVDLGERILFGAALLALAWVAGGWIAGAL